MLHEGLGSVAMWKDFPERLARYHSDADLAFWLWNDLWLDPTFRAWNIEHYLLSITCPILAIQGYEDEYGTMEQLERLRGVHLKQLRSSSNAVAIRPIEIVRKRYCRRRCDS
jgi:hypothetical protein